MQNSIDKLIEQANEGLNLGQSNSITSSTAIENDINTNLDTIISKSISDSFDTSQTTEQNIVFVNKGTVTGDQCTFSNTSVSEVMGDNFSKNTLDTLTSNTASVETQNDIKETFSQKNTGLDFAFFAVIALIFLLLIFGPVLIPLLFKSFKISPKILLVIFLIVFIVGTTFTILNIQWQNENDKAIENRETVIKKDYTTTLWISIIAMIIGLLGLFYFLWI